MQPTASQWEALLRSRLRQRRRDGLERQRLVLESPQSASVQIDGEQFLNFCSNDYLGLANHPDVVGALIDGVRRWGVGAGASHMVAGHYSPHRDLEEELAGWLGFERALLFSSGYMANLALGQVLVGREDFYLQDKLNHASLIDSGLLSRATFSRYVHADVQSLIQRMDTAQGARMLVATDGVFSMDGDVAPIEQICEAISTRAATFAVDDAHGLGVIGPGGRGSLEETGTAITPNLILIGTLGKAFGTAGAFLAGSNAMIENFLQFSRTYTYTTALPPSIAVATMAALDIVREESWRRVRLRHLIERFRSEAEVMGFSLVESYTPIQPILLGDIERTLRASEQLRREGVLVTAIRPPTVPKGSSRLRVTFSAAHSDGDMDKLLNALSRLEPGKPGYTR